MKTLAFTILMTLACMQGHAQTFTPTNLISIHHAELKLAEGVTFDEYFDYYVDYVIPAQESIWRGVKITPIIGIRGTCTDCLGYIMTIPSEELRDKYFKENGITKYTADKLETIQEVLTKVESLGTVTNHEFTDWKIL